MRFIRRWKYTLTVSSIIIISGVIMLFFPYTRKAGILCLFTSFLAFVSVGVRYL